MGHYVAPRATTRRDAEQAAKQLRRRLAMLVERAVATQSTSDSYADAMHTSMARLDAYTDGGMYMAPVTGLGRSKNRAKQKALRSSLIAESALF